MSRKARLLCLSVRSGPWVGKTYEVPVGATWSFGRTKGDIVFDVDTYMSSLHFEIENRGADALLRDLGSRNKTWLNREPVREKVLSEGDQIVAGKTDFLVGWKEGDQEATLNPELLMARETPIPPPVPEPVSSHHFASLLSEVPTPPPQKEAPPSNDLGYSFSPSIFALPEVATSEEKVSSIGVDLAGWHNHSETSSSCRCMSLRGERMDDAYSRVAKALQEQTALSHVAHFRKLGVDTHANIPLVPLLGDTRDESSWWPAVIRGGDWEQVEASCRSRLLENDGLVLVFGSESAEGLTRLTRAGLKGFSEPGGLVGWFWPSVLSAIQERVSLELISEWLGNDIGGLVYPDIRVGNLAAIAQPSHVPLLQEIGFEICSF